VLDDSLYKLAGEALVEAFLMPGVGEQGMAEQTELERAPDLGAEATAVDTGERLRLSPWHHLARLTARAEALVGAGAIVGVLGRFAIGELAKHYLPGPLPLGTVLINLLGCLVIGIVQTLFLDLAAIRREPQLLLAVGFCGGFTTFSTFSVETVQLLQAGHVGPALAYGALSLAGGLAAVLLGVAIVHLPHRRLRRRA
jgi:CrcB protein